MVQNVKIGLLKNNPYNAKPDYNEQRIAYLMESIELQGYLSNEILPVRPLNGGYQLGYGHRRVEAARRLGIKELPVEIKERSDDEMFALLTRENTTDGSKSPQKLREEVATSKMILDGYFEKFGTYEEYKRGLHENHVFANKAEWGNTKAKGSGWRSIRKHIGLSASGNQVAVALTLNKLTSQYPELAEAINVFPDIYQEDSFADTVTDADFMDVFGPDTWKGFAQELLAEFGEKLSPDKIRTELMKWYHDSLKEDKAELSDLEKIEKLLAKVISAGKALGGTIGVLTEKLDTYGKGTKIGGITGLLAQSDLYLVETSIHDLYTYLGVEKNAKEIEYEG